MAINSGPLNSKLLRGKMMSTDSEVVVVGAGPSGIIVTNELLRRGIDVKWIDARPEPLGTTRAFSVHARTFEMLEHVGIAHKALEVNAICPGNRFIIAEMDLLMEEMPVLDFRKLENTRYNFYGKVNQHDLETILRNHIASQHTVSPQWGVECLSVYQGDGGIDMEIINKTTGKTETLRPDWVIGADGYFTMSMMDVPLEAYEGDDD